MPGQVAAPKTSAPNSSSRPCARQPRVARQLPGGGERRAQPVDLPAAVCPDQRGGRQLSGDRQDGREREGRFAAVPGEGLTVAGHGAPYPDRAHQGERDDRDEDRHRVRQRGPGQAEPDEHRDVPPGSPGGNGGPSPRQAARPVDQEEDEQDGDTGAGVVGREQERLRAGPGLRREHDPRRQQRPGHAFAAPRPAPGEQGRRQDEQRVGHRARHVDDVRGQAAGQLDQRVLRELGGVERDVGDPPAVQQRVAVQQVPRLERLRRAV